MEQLPAKDSAQAVFVAEAIRKYWRTIVVTVLIVTGAAIAYEVVRAGSYVAHSTALIRPLTGNAYSAETATSTQNATVALETEAQLVNSDPVASQVSDQSSTAGCKATSVVSTVLTNTQLVQVTYTAPDSHTAQICADAFVHKYLDYRRSLAVQSQTSQLTALQTEADNTSNLLAAANSDLHSPHPSLAAAANVRNYTTRLAALQTQIGEVQAESTQPGFPVAPAVEPVKAAGVSSTLIVVGGALAGLVLGFLIAIWRGRRSRGVVSEHATHLAGVPVLASISAVKKAATGMPIPRARSDEEFQFCAVATLARTPTHRAIAVASLVANDSVAGVSFRFARALAHAGYRVVLVDAGEHRPTIGEIVEASDRPPAGEDEASRDLVGVTRTYADGVELVATGVDPRGNAIRRSIPRMRDLIQRLTAEVDFVIVNASSVNSPSGLEQLLVSDAAVLVTHDHVTRFQDFIGARQIAERMDIDLLGTVVIRNSKADFTPAKAVRSSTTPPAANRGETRRGVAPGDDTMPTRMEQRDRDRASAPRGAR
jgi:polysaccharide biosynthesis transport protein